MRPSSSGLLKRSAQRMLTHTYTRTPFVDGTEDSEGNVPRVPGTAVPSGVCLYSTEERSVRDEGGVAVVSTPTLRILPEDPLVVGDQVSDIRDRAGTVLQDGPLRVERLITDTAQAGTSILHVWELRSGTVSP
jgi:hypothetical protein